ncbi:hypothetical protein PSHT_01540 [Puccinia striiformis]|uniref:Uncharacterized protein n=1 Tax=Puccinia striiformis TaxID=27350 RepID=A0A2S4WKB2_9BASI|nr:hypothetical protein PSHT_01540 [Puccinia striiformis]
MASAPKSVNFVAIKLILLLFCLGVGFASPSVNGMPPALSTTEYRPAMQQLESTSRKSLNQPVASPGHPCHLPTSPLSNIRPPTALEQDTKGKSSNCCSSKMTGGCAAPNMRLGKADQIFEVDMPNRGQSQLEDNRMHRRQGGTAASKDEGSTSSSFLTRSNSRGQDDFGPNSPRMMPMVPLKTLIRTPVKKVKEVPANHWVKLYRNRHKLKMLAQLSSSQEVKFSSSPEQEIAAYWSNLAKPKPVEHLGNDSKPQDPEPNHDLNSSPSQHSCVEEDMQIERRQHVGHLFSGQREIQTREAGRTKIWLEEASDQSQMGTSITGSNIRREAARKHWRTAAVKVKTLSAWGILENKTISKADSYVFTAHHWLERFTGLIDRIHNILAATVEFGNTAEDLQTCLRVKNHPQIDSFDSINMIQHQQVSHPNYHFKSVKIRQLN